MLAFAFLNPLLLWALPLAAVPIIIHILNRRRFKKVPWAAMEFLLRAMKRNRKRLRLEQWLVLLLRVLAVLLLALLVARPQLGGGGLIGTVTHHVVMLDDSASMTQRSGSATLFERAQDRVRSLADDLAKTRNGDLFSIVRSSRGKEPDVWKSRVGPDLGRRTGTSLKEWTVNDGSADLGQVVADTQRRAATVEEASRTHYYLITDQRAYDFTTPDDKPRPALQAAIAAMEPETEHLTVLGVGGQHPNLAVADVRLVDRLAVANVPVTLAVDIKNHGLDATMPTTVAVGVDGQSSVSLAVPQLAPGQLVSLPLSHTFGAAGFHRVEARLEPSEHFPLDDGRAFAIDVRERSRVLLVDGDPDEQDGECFYLQTAFDPDDDGRFGVETQVVTDTGLGELDLQQFDFVWLCNVQTPSSDMVQRLEQFVASGGGLTIFCGQVVDAQRYNELLWRDGKGLLPLPLGEIDGDPDRPEAAVLVKKDHPICERLGDVYELLMNRVVLVHRWLTIADDFAHDAAVVARIRDAEGPPLIVTRPYGSGGGQVTMFAITADKHWSNFPVTDLFVPAVMELHRFGVRRDDPSGQNLLPNGIYRTELDPGLYRPDVTLRALAGDGEERTFTAVEVKTATETAPSPTPSPESIQPRPLALTVPMSELRELGAYEVEFSRHDGVPHQRMLARNATPAESQLVGFTPATFLRLFPKELHDRVTFVAADAGLGAGPGEGEIWKLLAAALVAGLLLESLLAWRFGRR
ncbi:MAG: BatA domain-containing protein [Planctomycetes bacterium]|nr:BatA domain-containing protein [Planctomycetota bacterium]